jgi:hypothetical protein
MSAVDARLALLIDAIQGRSTLHAPLSTPIQEPASDVGPRRKGSGGRPSEHLPVVRTPEPPIPPRRH